MHLLFYPYVDHDFTFLANLLATISRVVSSQRPRLSQTPIFLVYAWDHRRKLTLKLSAPTHFGVSALTFTLKPEAQKFSVCDILSLHIFKAVYFTQAWNECLCRQWLWQKLGAAAEYQVSLTTFWRRPRPKQLSNMSSFYRNNPGESEEEMMHHHHNQRFYQYAGPPSIVMGTWGDRSRSQFAPPPAPFAIPPAGVPGGRLGPSPNRIAAGYHSLQYTPADYSNGHHPHHHKKSSSSSEHKERKISSSSSRREHHKDELHKSPQVKSWWSASLSGSFIYKL